MKRKTLAKREPSGKPKRSSDDAVLLSPVEVHRMRAAAAQGLRDGIWGSVLGYLLLTGKITNAQFAAGKRWSEIAAEYQQAMRSPSPPQSPQIERTKQSGDESEHERDATALREFANAFSVLVLAGSDSRRAVIRVCERNEVPAGLDDLLALRAGLDALMAFWMKPRRKAQKNQHASAQLR